MSFFNRASTMRYWLELNGAQMKRMNSVLKEIDVSTISVEVRVNINGMWFWISYESARSLSNTIRINYSAHSLLGIYNVLVDNYPALEKNPNSAIDIGRLKRDLNRGLLFFTIDDKRIESELSDFFFMNKFLSIPEQSGFDTEKIAPYNKCRALFMVLHYMKRDAACMNLLNSMGFIMANFNGMISPEELLLPPSDRFASMKQVKLLIHSFPTLVHMQKSYYRFLVLNINDEFFSMGPRLLGMNKISYYDFAEQLDGMSNEYINYLESMIFTFKLLIPDQEKFRLAKQIGFIDSSVIDWTFCYNKVILRDIPSYKGEEFLIKSHYQKLVELKRRYFNFFSNLVSDYYTKLVHEPVSIVFNVAAVIFAIAGVIQVLQQAGVIPPLVQSSGSSTSG